MRNSFLVTLICVIPIIFILNEDIKWEAMTLRFIRTIGDPTGARAQLASLKKTSEVAYEDFRIKQVLICALFGIPLSTLLLLMGKKFSLVVIGINVVILLTVVFTEMNLRKRVKKFQLRIESDFPAIVEMLTLSLSAGETPLGALSRISTRGTSPLIDEFAVIVEDVRQGRPFTDALDHMGRRIDSSVVRRFVDAIAIAISRGAPLIDVLHGHAREARDYQRNRVLNAAGKAEISMMIPVVFLILPISILFALWPSLSGLDLFASA
jgi:tight adherence protein C